MSTAARRTRRTRKAPMRFELDRDQPKALRMCQGVLQKLMQHQLAHIFSRPVDPVALGIPDYFDVIKTPMDMHTVHKRLTSGFYDSNPERFREDMDLIWQNAMTYNPPGHFVYSAAETMKLSFLELFRTVEAQLRNDEEKAKAKMVKAKGLFKAKNEEMGRIRERCSIKKKKRIKRERKSGTNVKDLMKSSTEELIALRRQFADLKKKIDRAQLMKARREKKRKASSQAVSKEKKLTKEQKNILMQGIQSLPEEKLNTLVSMLDPNAGDDEEVHLDLDTMSTEMFNKISRFVQRHNKRSEFTTPDFSINSPARLADISDSESSDSEDDE